jgi:hypothetical protein
MPASLAAPSLPSPDGPLDWLAIDPDALDLAPILSAYRQDGFALIPGVASQAALTALTERAHAIMTGAVDHRPFFFQHDAATGRYEDAPLGEGWVGPSPAYRKIEKLERDPVFLRWTENALFARLARTLVGPDIALYRAILMTKPARTERGPGGTLLPWHQDAGALWGLDRSPRVQLWTALDDAPRDAGCMVFAKGTHLEGLASALGGIVPPSVHGLHPAALDPVVVPAKAGDVVLLDNLVWHASALNTTPHPRRAFSVCFMDPATRCTRKRGAPRTFPRVFAPVSAPSAAHTR